MDDSPHEGGEASKNAHYFRPTSIATGLPWHVARRKRDRQLIAAAKKGLAVKGGIPLSSIGHSGGFLSPSSTGFGAGTEGEAEEQAGEVDISIDEALQRGADVNAADYNGNTALHYACEEGYVDVVEYLLQKKDISVDATATMDWTPLHSAAYKGRTDIIKMMIAAKCDGNAQARDSNNALHLAALGGSLSAVRVLVAAGVDAGALNEEGQTPLKVATLFRNREWRLIAAVLQEAQVNPPPSASRRSRQTSWDRFALQITLVKGDQLKALDLFQESDPYCACCISNPPGFVRSKTIEKASAPQWNQILMLRINLVPQYLRVEVWDDDFGKTKDDFIGAGTVNLSPLVADTKQRLETLALDSNNAEDPELPETELWLEIQAGGRFTGKVMLKVKIRKMKPLRL